MFNAGFLNTTKQSHFPKSSYRQPYREEWSEGELIFSISFSVFEHNNPVNASCYNCQVHCT